MQRRISTVLPWLALAAAVALVSTATISLAGSSESEPTIELLAPVEFAEAQPLVVPDVTRQPYVFAKGILEDSGFAWKVRGKVEGFPGNTVGSQDPPAGTEVQDTGMPTVGLRLERNEDYEQRGVPNNSSPYEGSPLVLWAATQPEQSDGPSVDAAESLDEVESLLDPVEPPSVSDTPTGAGDEAAEAVVDPDGDGRPGAFVEPGAPPEPIDEIPLVKRAENLARDLANEPEATPELVDHWLFQHEWIVTGAEFGWSGGVEALERLIAIDEDLEERWGIGAKSAEVAREALAEVSRKTDEATSGP